MTSMPDERDAHAALLDGEVPQGTDFINALDVEHATDSRLLPHHPPTCVSMAPPVVMSPATIRLSCLSFPVMSF